MESGGSEQAGARTRPWSARARPGRRSVAAGRLKCALQARALLQLVAAAGEVGGLAGVAGQLDGPVVGRA